MAEFDIQKLEEKILKFWDDRNIFARTLKEREGKKRFVFFDGPPTANGKPGIHHFIGRVFKDLWPRYKTMRGYYVARKAGWDTHGLPVEIEVEKELGLKNKKDIEAYGIAKFNAKAKTSVWKYKEEWQRFTRRIGFWLDLQHPYITYEPSYMESLWWVIAQINKRGLLYEGHKVLPWCTRCGTGLSSHELAQGYKEVTDTSVTWKFKVAPKTYFLAWTTTPWSTISTMGLSVGPDYTYIKASVGDEYYYVVKDRAEAVLGSSYTVIEEVKGKDLVGMKYEPLMDLGGSYQVYPADYVELTDGTGIVTINGSYGEIDMEQAKKYKLPIIIDVDPDGRFNKKAGKYAGMPIREAQELFITDMQAKGLVWKTEPYTHSYPHCWRCKTPLIYYAKDSWFIGMSTLRKQLLKNNKKINWYPEHLKEGRFGEFLREVKDWAFSRERYWGTPLPVWKCSHCKAQRVIGSLAELDEHRTTIKNTYHLLRHGGSMKGTPGGDVDIISSQLDKDHYDLTPEGIARVQKSAEQLKADGGVDVIIASPFLRTKHTAKIVATELKKNFEVDDRLKELNHGTACEGSAHGLCLPPIEELTLDTKHGDGESWNDVRSRVYDLIRDLEKKHEGKRILIVSHGAPLLMFRAISENMSDRNILEIIRANNYQHQGELRHAHIHNHPRNEDGVLDLHRPYIDEVVLKCSECEGKMHRVKEVVDVWFDSGAMPYAQWSAPGGSAVGGPVNWDLVKQNFPADFITEAIDQTRGWFYTLLAVSTLLDRGAPYKNVVSYSHVLDDKGKKMSKSLGNIVDPWKVIEQYGVDATRWYFYTVNSPGDPKLFAIADVGKRLHGFIMTLFNSLRFFKLYEKPTGSHPKAKPEPQSQLDDWILSRLHTAIHVVTTSLEKYDPTTASRAIEQFVVEDMSNWWIRRSRDRFQHPADDESYHQTLNFFRYLLIKVSKICAPFIPFVAEHIYKQVANRKESVHLENWPTAEKKFIKPELEAQMRAVREVVAAALAQRKIANLKVRQPLASLTTKQEIAPELAIYIKDEVNVKQVITDPAQTEPVKLDTTITHELKLEGYARELMRRIQDMRKEAGCKLDDKVVFAWSSASTDVKSAIHQFNEQIMRDTLLAKFDEEPKQPEKESFAIDAEFDLAPGAPLWLGLKK